MKYLNLFRIEKYGRLILCLGLLIAGMHLATLAQTELEPRGNKRQRLLYAEYVCVYHPHQRINRSSALPDIHIDIFNTLTGRNKCINYIL